MNISRRRFFDLFRKSVPAVLVVTLLPSRKEVAPEVKPEIEQIGLTPMLYPVSTRPIAVSRDLSSASSYTFYPPWGVSYVCSSYSLKPKTKKEMLQDDYNSLGVKNSRFDDFDKQVKNVRHS